MYQSKSKNMSLKRKVKLILLHIKRKQHSPDYIAGGLSIGIFVAFTPTMGMQTVIAVFLAIVLKKSKLLAALGVWISNPWSAIPLYTLCYKVGLLFFKTNYKTLSLHPITLEHIMRLSREIFIPLCLGGIVLGLISSTLVYIFTMTAIHLYHKIKSKK